MATLAEQAKWIVEKAKERAENGDIEEWLTALSDNQRNHIYFHLLPRSRGFMPDPEKWVQDTIDALKKINGRGAI